MKRILTILLACILLTGCGGETAPAENAAAETVPEEAVPVEEPAQAPVTGLTMELEHEAYDPSLDSLTYFVQNATEEPVDFGEDYRFQRQENGQWMDLPFAENTGFNDMDYTLAAGETMALTCWLGMLRDAPTAGTYRLVKTVGGQTLYAKFELGDSPYTAETPYGFAPLEGLPDSYGADTAADTDVVFTGDGARNDGLAEDFLYKVSLGAPCQLRTVQDYGEGAVMVTDVICENGCFLWRMRSGDHVAELRFSYIVTDGEDLYLSNGADWDSGEEYGDQRTFLLPEGTASPAMVTRVQEMTADRLAWNTTRYKVWSADGVWFAALTEGASPTAFSIQWQKSGEGSWSKGYDLQSWDGLETEILGLAWQEDDILRLTCRTADGQRTARTFDPEMGGLCYARDRQRD